MNRNGWVGAQHKKFKEKQWTAEKWAAIPPEQRRNMLNPMHRVPYRLTPGRVEANRVRAQNLWRQYQCAPGCACCPDEAAREANARKKQSAHMKRLQQKADRAVKERGKQYLDEHHPGWREE